MDTYLSQVPTSSPSLEPWSPDSFSPSKLLIVVTATSRLGDPHVSSSSSTTRADQQYLIHNLYRFETLYSISARPYINEIGFPMRHASTSLPFLSRNNRCRTIISIYTLGGECSPKAPPPVNCNWIIRLHVDETSEENLFCFCCWRAVINWPIAGYWVKRAGQYSAKHRSSLSHDDDGPRRRRHKPAYSDERDADTMGYLWFPNPSKWVYGFNKSDAQRFRPRRPVGWNCWFNCPLNDWLLSLCAAWVGRTLCCNCHWSSSSL